MKTEWGYRKEISSEVYMFQAYVNLILLKVSLKHLSAHSKSRYIQLLSYQDALVPFSTWKGIAVTVNEDSLEEESSSKDEANQPKKRLT